MKLIPQPHNSHIHLPPNFSAFDTIEQAVQLASEQKLAALGASNYYDYSIYGGFQALCLQHHIFPLLGLEVIALLEDLRDAGVKLNDPGNPGKMYLCGKGLARASDPTPQGAALLQKIRSRDEARMEQMVGRMRAVLAERGANLDVTLQSIREGIVRRHGCHPATVVLQERHVAQGFQEALYEQVPRYVRRDVFPSIFGEPAAALNDAVGVQTELRNAFMKAGKPAFVAETFLSYQEARQFVLEMGGIPSYPVLGDGAKIIGAFEATPQRLAANLRDLKLHAVEFIPVRNNLALLEQYVPYLREQGFMVTAGTEHNTLDLIPLNPTAVKGAPIPPPLQAIFWEGACAVAAHQQRVQKGQTGYVDAQGDPNVGFATRAALIDALAAEGQELIEGVNRQVT